jgi:creatinine amidohydrolase
MFHLANLNFMDVDRLSKSDRPVVVVPIGSVEEHGPHLPLALDTFAAEVYAKEIAPHLEEHGFEVILAPSIYYGVAQQALGFPGTLTIKPDTLTSLLIDVGSALSSHGFKRLVMLNGHRDLEHMGAISRAVEFLQASGMDVVSVGFVSDSKITAACFRQGMQGISRSTRPEMEGHAGEWETSLALHSFPELVDRDIAQSLQPNVSYDVDAFRAETVNYQILSNGTGYFGSPAVATAETGRGLLAVRGRNMAGIILKAFTPEEKGT